jgi:hypothetical protein
METSVDRLSSRYVNSSDAIYSKNKNVTRIGINKLEGDPQPSFDERRRGLRKCRLPRTTIEALSFRRHVFSDLFSRFPHHHKTIFVELMYSLSRGRSLCNFWYLVFSDSDRWLLLPSLAVSYSMRLSFYVEWSFSMKFCEKETNLLCIRQLRMRESHANECNVRLIPAVVE